MRNIIASMEAEYRKYKRLGEIAINQLSEAELARPAAAGSNTTVNLVWHLSANLKSRFTDFLTTDGEKEWRKREEEFQPRTASHAELLVRWNEGWSTLFRSLEQLVDSDLAKVVAIDGKPHRVDEALHRSLAHTSYHVGQMIFIAKAIRGGTWKSSTSFDK